MHKLDLNPYSTSEWKFLVSMGCCHQACLKQNVPELHRGACVINTGTRELEHMTKGSSASIWGARCVSVCRWKRRCVSASDEAPVLSWAQKGQMEDMTLQ
jgi:hypothetical protein